ncbi:hypothetical protein Hdeb2414_s0003g00112211 [Helianthus debilis subsp. tardiflorus]
MFSFSVNTFSCMAKCTLLGPSYVDGIMFAMNNLYFKCVVKIIFNVYVVFYSFVILYKLCFDVVMVLFRPVNESNEYECKYLRVCLFNFN